MSIKLNLDFPDRQDISSRKHHRVCETTRGEGEDIKGTKREEDVRAHRLRGQVSHIK